MLLSLFLLSLSLYRLKISTSVERSSVAPPCAPVTSHRRATPVPAPTGGAARHASSSHRPHPCVPSLFHNSTLGTPIHHLLLRKGNMIMTDHTIPFSYLTWGRSAWFPRLVASALTGEMGDWVCLSPAEFSQLQQYSECEYLSTRSFCPLTSGRLIGIDFGAVRWIRMDERFYRSI